MLRSRMPRLPDDPARLPTVLAAIATLVAALGRVCTWADSGQPAGWTCARGLARRRGTGSLVRKSRMMCRSAAVISPDGGWNA
jgi:hypothetical protein